MRGGCKFTHFGKKAGSLFPDVGANVTRRFAIFLMLFASSLVVYGAFAYDSLTVGESVPVAPGIHAAKDADGLEPQFAKALQPFFKTYCVACHGKTEPEAELDVTAYDSVTALVKDARHLDLLIERIKTEEMPPKKSKTRPSAELRRDVVAWLQAVRDREISRHAGERGIVLARRLSNAEYNYTIRDLTGVDIRPTREFPVDPANTAGFDNSGESLAMSPALLNKYLKAAYEVASHMVLQPVGFTFAPHPMAVETDQDRYCVSRIIDFYHRFDTDYAAYFEAAWRFKHREALGKGQAALADFCSGTKLSAKYLETLWSLLEGRKEDFGPNAKLQSLWSQLPPPQGGEPEGLRQACEQMRDFVVKLRAKVETRFLNISSGRVGAGRNPF